MRVAVLATTEIANRAGRILLAERSLDRLGLLDGDPVTKSPKVERAFDLASYDIAFTDGDDEEFFADADRAGIACVASQDLEISWSADAPLLTGANLANGLAPALAAHEAAIAEGPVTIAWTVEGRPLRRGESVAFPDPVGSRWGERLESSAEVTRIAVPVQGEWAGAMVIVGASGHPQRSVGIADLGAHLEAIALAAGVTAVAAGAYPDGASVPEDRAEDYLLAALELGLEVAGFVGSA